MKWISLYILILVFSLVVNSCQTPNNSTTNNEDSEHPHTNHLIHSSSPYLLQHAHNPVNWYPWGKEALEKAKKEDKLLIISVGYAACHWCHVMEHESFEDTMVARLMNENFISIKVDREERPDVDQIYMNAAYLTTGRGGWPLNTVALPDGRPIFAGTYFPKENWIKVLTHFSGLKENKPESLETAADQITRGIQQMDMGSFIASEKEFDEGLLQSVYRGIEKNIDFKRGGLDKAPKFPMPDVHQFLLRYHHLTGDPKALEAVTVTLDNMANGGIFDHLGGGFARYSTDEIWKVPHFEKMLYDNGQLMSLYSEAWQVTGNDSYREVVYAISNFIEAEMTSPEGGFYSSLDADSEGEEGKFYVWTKEEIAAVLEGNTESFCEYFNVSTTGNWEGKNILYATESRKKIAPKHNLTEEQLTEVIHEGGSELLEKRNERIRPGLDDKILTAWNALMLKGYVDASRALGNPLFLDVALKNAAFLKKNMFREDGGLNRNYKDGKSSINGFADDYAFVIDAFIALYQATFDEQWLFDADALMRYALEHFYDTQTGMFFYTSDEDDPLITRSREVPDNVIPGSNSALAKDLFYLGTYLYNNDYLDKSRKMLRNVLESMNEEGPYYSNWAILLTHLTYEPYEVAIVGDRAEELRKEWDQHFQPNAFLLGGKSEGKLELLKNKKIEGETFIYVCQDKLCKLPVQSVEEALRLVE
ncbi:MAG: thioredoxin domain-containing protein [Bacteroidia bacterium]